MPHDQDPHDQDQRVRQLEDQLAERAARSTRDAVDNLTDALVSGAMAGTMKVIRPIAEEVRAQGGSLADMVDDFLAPFRGEDPRE